MQDDDSNPSCEGLYSALDCLSLSDFIVENILLAICIVSIIIVLYRLKKMAQPSNYTIQQTRQLYKCSFIHWITLLYMIVFSLCTIVACLIYCILKYRWFLGEEEVKPYEADVVQTLIKVFWVLLYGYISILNIVFFIIAYNFLVKSKILRHEQVSQSTFWGCFIIAVLQFLCYIGYIYLILAYENNNSLQSHYLQILRYTNLSWSILCTVVLLYIFCIIYRQKVSSSAFISQHVKRIENRNIFFLTLLHILRIVVEVFNIASGGMICMWRQLDKQTYLDNKFYYSIYLSVVNMLMNILPVLFILKVFKPPKKEFMRPSLVQSEWSGTSYLDQSIN